MNQPTESPVNFGTIVTTLKRHWYLVVVSTVLATGAALAYAVLRQPQWEAAQALLVRDEAGSEADQPGRFATADAMKTSQETIQEVARNHEVVAATLGQLGPPPGHPKPDQWPTGRDIETAQDRIRVGAPGGVEFGRTEVIYLTVTDVGSERAVAFCTTLCDQLDKRLQRLRNEKAKSMIVELERAVSFAEQDLQQANARLQTLERQVGTDLGELRALSDAGAGDGTLRSSRNQLESELREAEGTLRRQRQQQKLLATARNNAEQLLTTPNDLLESQPALRRLKEGLIDAQLRTAELKGMMNSDHPRVKAAVIAEEGVRHEIRAELDEAVRGLAADVELSQDRIASLHTKMSEVRHRLDCLADVRVDYSKLVAEVQQRTRIVEERRGNLAQAGASQTAAQTASLLTRVDSPRAGDFPIGPGRKLIVLAGVAGGLAIGLGLVFLVSPVGVQVGQLGRRWTDRVMTPWGRRQTDTHAATGAGRRASDQAAASDGFSGRRMEDRVINHPDGQRVIDRRKSHQPPGQPVIHALVDHRAQEPPAHDTQEQEVDRDHRSDRPTDDGRMAEPIRRSVDDASGPSQVRTGDVERTPDEPVAPPPTNGYDTHPPLAHQQADPESESSQPEPDDERNEDRIRAPNAVPTEDVFLGLSVIPLGDLADRLLDDPAVNDV